MLTQHFTTWTSDQVDLEILLMHIRWRFGDSTNGEEAILIFDMLRFLAHPLTTEISLSFSHTQM